MIELHFEGYSDNTFGEYKHFGCNYDNSASGEPIQWLISSSGGKLLVSGQYCPQNADGWLIGVASLSDSHDDIPLPNWPMRIENSDRPYSPRLVIQAPDDCEITCFQHGE